MIALQPWITFRNSRGCPQLYTSSLWRRALSGQSLVARSLILVMMPTASAFATTRQLAVAPYSSPSGGSFTITFVACATDPIGECGTPLPGGCGTPACSASVSCQQTDESALAAAIVAAINSAGCQGYSGTDDGLGAFSVTYPDSVCLCSTDSASGESFPLSNLCDALPVCNNAWLIYFTGFCPTDEQPTCIAQNVFGASAIHIDFDGFSNGTTLSSQIARLIFQNTIVDASGLAVSPPNRIVPINTGAPIHIDFQPPVLRVGCNIDSDGFTDERKPQFRAYGVHGTIAICNFEQGPSFKAAQLPDCERIVAVELGSVHFADCNYLGSDGFDNLVLEYPFCADIDGNGTISGADRMRFVSALLGTSVVPCDRAAADVNSDGEINGLDVQAFIDCFFP